MCNRLSPGTRESVKKQLPDMEVMEYSDRNVSIGYDMPQGMPITTTEHPKKVYGGMWKLIPHWLTTWEEARAYANTLNARCEDIFTKNSYRQYIGTNRALLWVNGFFEPQHPDKKGDKKGITVPQYVKPKDGKIMSLGCVYNNWRNPDTGRLITTFAIITTEPNALLAEVNNDGMRMPLGLSTTAICGWQNYQRKKLLL